MLKLNVVETPKGFYISDVNESGVYAGGIGSYLCNGVKPEKTWHRYWFLVPELPTVIEREVGPRTINCRYELIRPELASDSIPLVLQKQDVEYGEDDDDGWTSEYRHLRSLYKLACDKTEPYIGQVEFEIVEHVKLDCDIEKGSDLCIPMFSRDKKPRHLTISSLIGKGQLIDKILFPEIVGPVLPVKLSREESYAIVRQHIIENIDHEYAEITSNYDFWLTVEKRVRLPEKIEYQADITKPGQRKKRYETRYRTHRRAMVYRTSPSGYNRYPTIEPFFGNSYADLQEKIKKFLNKLMEDINEPIVDCPNCKGSGVLLDVHDSPVQAE